VRDFVDRRRRTPAVEQQIAQPEREMAYIKSRKHPAAQLPRVAGCTAALTAVALALPAAAQTPPQADAKPAAEQALPEVKAKGKATSQGTYKADTVSSPKVMTPLVNTPQTITVIKKELLLEQGATTLAEALGNTPGITFQMGENGNTQTGDSIFMRGFDTQQSIFVDGIRDIGTFSRDTFNIEQVEVVKGPAGADIGRGSPTGYVNLATKLPTLDDLASGSITIASGSRKRVTADVNRAIPLLGDGTAVRINFQKTDSGAVERDHVKKDSWAFAPSLALGLGTPTRTYLYYLHVEQDNRPDGGIPAIGLPAYRNTAVPAGASPVNRSNFYGSLSDFDRVKADMFTARIEHDLKAGYTLRNISRFGRTEQRYVLTGVNTITVPDANDPSTWTVSRSRQGKDQENQVLTNQTNLNAEFETGSFKHLLSTGIEFIYEKQTNNAMAVVGTQGAANLYNPTVDDVFAPVAATGAKTSGNTVTAAIYAFDTLKINERFQINGGVRFEKYKTETLGIPASNATVQTATLASKADDLLTWKVGALYKPASNGSVYVAYATSQKPPGSDSFALNTGTTLNINSATLEPSEADSLEIGTKWELFDNRMALTAALFDTETRNDSIENGTVAIGDESQMGKKTVKGLELGAAGMITSAWQVNAGLAWMDTEVVQAPSQSSTQTGNSLAWSPKLSFTSWTTYKLPMGLTVGGGARFVKSMVRNSNPVASTANLPSIPSYWVFDAMAGYEVNRNVSVQLNVKNIADKFYIQSLNNGGSRFTLGAPRTLQLTANLQY
jgi:catecholate siderophore receptor